MIELIVYILATWRIASLLVNEKGPGDVFLKLRERVGLGHDSSGNVAAISDGFFPGVLSCVWCCSIWVGFGWMVLGWIYPLFALKLAMAFSFSAGAIVIQRCLEIRR